MADIEARREARRRKILENSEKRLKKIIGVEDKSVNSDLDGINLNKSYISEPDSSRLSNLTSESLKDHHLDNSVTHNSLELETIFQNPRSIANDSVSSLHIGGSESKSNRYIFVFVVPLILSSVLVFFDFLQVDIKPYYLNKIFIPLIIYEIVEYFFNQPHNSSNFLTSVLLTNIRNQFLAGFVQYFQHFLNILQDVMVYFFVFTVSFWLLQTILL